MPLLMGNTLLVLSVSQIYIYHFLKTLLIYMYKGVEIVYRESKLKLSDFICNDRFVLNSYLSYLFDKFNDNVGHQSEDKMIPSSRYQF